MNEHGRSSVYRMLRRARGKFKEISIRALDDSAKAIRTLKLIAEVVVYKNVIKINCCA